MATDEAVNDKIQGSPDSIKHALTLLNLLLDSEEGMSLTELDVATKIGKNKTYRLLTSLEQSGVIQKNSQGKYCLGTSAYATAGKIVSKSVSARRFRPVLVKLAKQFNETVYFASSSAGRATLIDMAEGTHKVTARSFIGDVLSQGDDARENRPGIQMKVVDGARVCSGAMDPEVTTVSIDISNKLGTVIGSLVVLAPTFRMSPARIVAEVIPVMHETIRLMPQLDALSDGSRQAPTVLQLVPKRDEVYGNSGVKSASAWQ